MIKESGKSMMNPYHYTLLSPVNKGQSTKAESQHFDLPSLGLWRRWLCRHYPITHSTQTVSMVGHWFCQSCLIPLTKRVHPPIYTMVSLLSSPSISHLLIPPKIQSSRIWGLYPVGADISCNILARGFGSSRSPVCHSWTPVITI